MDCEYMRAKGFSNCVKLGWPMCESAEGQYANFHLIEIHFTFIGIVCSILILAASSKSTANLIPLSERIHSKPRHYVMWAE